MTNCQTSYHSTLIKTETRHKTPRKENGDKHADESTCITSYMNYLMKNVLQSGSALDKNHLLSLIIYNQHFLNSAECCRIFSMQYHLLMLITCTTFLFYSYKHDSLIKMSTCLSIPLGTEHAIFENMVLYLHTEQSKFHCSVQPIKNS